MKLVAYRWFTGRHCIGVVLYQNNYGVFKAVMTRVEGVNHKDDLQTIMDYGSKIPKAMALGALLDGQGTIEDITLLNEYKNQEE